MCEASEYSVFQKKLKHLNETMTIMTLQLSTAIRMAEAQLPSLMREYQEIRQLAEYLGISTVG